MIVFLICSHLFVFALGFVWGTLPYFCVWQKTDRFRDERRAAAAKEGKCKP